MTQFKFYKYATYGLVALNLSMLAFFIFNRGHVSHRAIDSLKLDEAQHVLFLQSVRKHQQTIEPINEQQQQLLETYFKTLINSNQQINEAQLEQVSKLERLKIEATYLHFKEVKSILREDQYDNFESFMNRLLTKVLPRTKKMPPQPDDF